MIILGIESATSRASVAIGGSEGVIADAQITNGRRHGEVITPTIQHLLRSSDFVIEEVSVVAIDVGPGLFTGLRVGMATAKALSLGLGVPMMSFCSLDLLAFPVRWSDRTSCTTIDARRGELFWSFYNRVQGGVQRDGDHQLGTPDTLAAELVARGESVLLVGDGAIRYAEIFSKLDNVEIASVGQSYPSAASIVELAQPRAMREEWQQSWEIEPMYMRDADAVPNWTQR